MNIASMIDHTILKADTTKAEILKVCKEAKDYKVQWKLNLKLLKQQGQ